jgi:hypothetical protein
MKKDLVLIKTDDDVRAIREKYARYGEDKNINKNTSVYHIRQLLAEVERLRGM